MKIYTYDPYNGNVFVGTTQADESPLEPGKFILPAYSTEVPPPDTRENNREVFFDPVKGKWSSRDIEKAAESEFNPYEGMDFDSAKEYKLFELKASKTVSDYAGFTFQDKTIDSDESSRTKILLAANQAAINDKFSIKWTAQDGSVLSLNSKEVLALASTLLDFISTNHEKYAALKRKVAAKKVKTVDDLAKITWE